MKNAFSRFMAGRYGTDKLNMLLLIAGLILSVVGFFVEVPELKFGLTMGSYGLVGLTIFRALSRNTYRRYRENRWLLQLTMKWKDREHRYYDCPRCRQQVRVPRGKGKISITCPKCKEKFVKKT